MRPQPNPQAEVLRRRDLELRLTGRTFAGGAAGVYSIGRGADMLRIIVGIGYGWEHVSASYDDRTPTWAEMCAVKDLFWGEEETVMQFHPKRSAYVDDHPHCLHLWKPIGKQPKLPPTILVGHLNKDEAR